jgi:hypothetical protein
MKITRQNTSEEYNTTVDWLKDFANSMVKNADFINNFKKIKNKEFGTIEEKMADIKSRVGFDIIKNIKEDENLNIKSAKAKCDHVKDSDQECNICKKKKIDPDKKEILKNIIEYAIDFGKNRPDASIEVIIHECKNHPGLKFEKIEKIINKKKLKELLESKLSKNRKKKEDRVKYVKDEDTSGTYNNDIADYISHAYPG